MFHICISDLDEGTKGTLSKFTDYTKLGRRAVIPPGFADVQGDLDRLESWLKRSLMKSNRRAVGSCT